jgi:hypothetical protein
MLGFFSDASEHPLADQKAVRGLFERLSRASPLDAMTRLRAGWNRSAKRVSSSTSVALICCLNLTMPDRNQASGWHGII